MNLAQLFRAKAARLRALAAKVKPTEIEVACNILARAAELDWCALEAERAMLVDATMGGE